MENQNALGVLFVYALAILIMLNGMAIMVGGNSLSGRLNRWVFRHLVLNPLRWLLRQAAQLLWSFIQWAVPQVLRLIGQGIRFLWVRLTT